MNKESGFQTAVFGSGCFWCSEAIFDQVRGVQSVEPGYAGGETENPTYKQVCSGSTGHAEVIRITFDPEVITYKDLLEIFWETHDPTTLNRQGNDIGTQYRSIVLYLNDEQKNDALEVKEIIEKRKSYENPIVTQIELLNDFYEAEDYHRDYYANNAIQPYCQFVISPKLTTFKKKFEDQMK